MNELSHSYEATGAWLPSAEQSREVVNAITSGKEVVLDHLPSIFQGQIDKLYNRYAKIVGELEPGYQPRNLPLYLLIQQKYPNFKWVETDHQFHIETYFCGEKRSLLSYLLGLIPVNKIANTAKLSRYKQADSHFAGMETCLSVLEQQGACSLSNENITRLQKWITKGQSGEAVTIVSPVCPDYSTVAGTDRKFRFTFESLGSGLGLSGLRIFESLQSLHDLFQYEFGISNIVHHFCVGDFEAFSAENRNRLGISKDRFISCNRDSSLALKASAPCPIMTSLFTDHCGGEDGWKKEYDAMKARFDSGEFGDLQASPMILEIAKARKQLYKRWYTNSAMEDSDLVCRVISQGVEYATMGKVITERFCNPLVLGADHSKMAPFYQFTGHFPVIYLDRNYE